MRSLAAAEAAGQIEKPVVVAAGAGEAKAVPKKPARRTFGRGAEVALKIEVAHVEDF